MLCLDFYGIFNDLQLEKINENVRVKISTSQWVNSENYSEA